MKSAFCHYFVVVLMVAALVTATFLVVEPAMADPRLPRAQARVCDAWGGVLDWYMEVIGWVRGAPITSGYVVCVDLWWAPIFW